MFSTAAVIIDISTINRRFADQSLVQLFPTKLTFSLMLLHVFTACMCFVSIICICANCWFLSSVFYLRCVAVSRDKEEFPVLGSVAPQMCKHVRVHVCVISFSISPSRRSYGTESSKHWRERYVCAGGWNIFVPSPLLESFSRPVFTEAYRMCLMFPWQRKR